MEYVRLAGWPILFILPLSLVCLALALRHAAIPQRSLVPLIFGFGAAAILFGLFGSVLGLQRSIEYIDQVPPEERWIWIKGLREALMCADFALFPTLLAALLTGIGSWRMARRQETIDAIDAATRPR